MLAKVLRELVAAPCVLHRMLAMTIRRRRGKPRLIEVLPEIKVMTVLMVQLRITLMLPKFPAMRCDEGSHG
jgi:hypothetical protein